MKEEITAVVANANRERGDAVVVKLKSGGGTVHGYGLAGQYDREYVSTTESMSVRQGVRQLGVSGKL